MKYMTMKKYAFNLQIFASEENQDGADPGDNDGQDEGDPDDDQDREDSADEKKYSQKDVDEAVKKRLARERRKRQRKQESEAEKDDGNKDSSKKPDESEDIKARKEVENKVSRMEVKIACYEADVAKESVDDVAALAKAYMEADSDLDLEDAIEKVVKKYPSFKKGSADPYEEDTAKNKPWGQRQTGRGLKKTDGVEAAFLKRNPGLKVD